MGGGVFPSDSRRVEKAEYESSAAEVIEALTNGGWDARLVPSYRCKENFGDIDILVTGEGKLTEDVQGVKGYRRHVRNGDCLSFLKEDIQVDLISVPKEEMDMSLAYFSWNDLGNLMGRVARQMGFRYGHRGLFQEVRGQGGQSLGKVRLSWDPEKIFATLGYDFQVWREGFDRIEDIFQFACSGQFFAKSCFLLHNLNHSTRVRNRKRKVYGEFLKWIEGRDLAEFDYTRVTPEEWQTRGKNFCGDRWLAEAESLRAQDVQRCQRRDKFNGQVVASLTGLHGSELGACMSAFRKRMGDRLDSWIDSVGSGESLGCFLGLKGGGEVVGEKAAERILRPLAQKSMIPPPSAKSDRGVGFG